MLDHTRSGHFFNIQDMQSKIAYIQNTHNTISDETTKAELAVQLTNLRATFEDEMEKKSRYEAAVKKTAVFER